MWLAAAFFCVSARVRAEQSDPQAQRAIARELGTAGMEAYFDGNYERAADNLDRAYRLFPTPTLGLWSGRAYIQLGRWVHAAERLREVQYASAAVGDAAAQQKAQADAMSELTSLEPRIPRLTITIAGATAAEVTLSIDEQPFERELIGIAHPIDPGPHTVVGRFQEQRVEVAVDLGEQANEVAHLEFKPAPPPRLSVAAALPAEAGVSQLTAAPAASSRGAGFIGSNGSNASSWYRSAAIVSVSVGGAALGASLASMLLARNKLSACDKRDGEYWCNDEQADAYDLYRGIATATFYAGAAFASAGIVLFVLQPSSDSQKQLTVSATPLGADVLVTF